MHVLHTFKLLYCVSLLLINHRPNNAAFARVAAQIPGHNAAPKLVIVQRLRLLSTISQQCSICYNKLRRNVVLACACCKSQSDSGALVHVVSQSPATL